MPGAGVDCTCRGADVRLCLLCRRKCRCTSLRAGGEKAKTKLLVPAGTLYQISVGARFLPLHPEPLERGRPNSALTGRKPPSRKFGLTIVNGWKCAAGAAGGSWRRSMARPRAAHG